MRLKAATDKQVAGCLGITARRVRQLVDEEVAVRTGPNEYDLPQTIQNYFAKKGDTTLEEARIKNLQLDNESRELALDKEYGEVHSRVEYEIALETTLANVAKALEGLKDNCLREEPNISEKIVEVIDGCAAQCQNHIADLLENAGRERDEE